MHGIRNTAQHEAIPPGKRKILMLSADHHFHDELITYAVHLAERLDYAVYAVNVHTRDDLESFRMASHVSWLQLKAYAERLGIDCGHSVRDGPLKDALEAIRAEVRCIEIIVTDIELTEHLKDLNVSIPIVGVLSTPENGQGGTTMANHCSASRKKQWIPTALFGLASAAFYTAIFMNAQRVMSYFTRGGWYAAMPIATVFVASYIHGSFASHLWSLLGIEAMRKDALSRTEKAVMAKKKAVGKKPRAYAYINPFHNV